MSGEKMRFFKNGCFGTVAARLDSVDVEKVKESAD